MQTELSTVEWAAVILITLLSLGGMYAAIQFARKWWTRKISEWELEEATANLNERALVGAARSAANNSAEAVDHLNVLQGSVLESAARNVAVLQELTHLQNEQNEQVHTLRCCVDNMLETVERVPLMINNLSTGTLNNLLSINKRLQTANDERLEDKELAALIKTAVKEAIAEYDKGQAD